MAIIRNEKYVLTVSYGNYRKGNGGTDKAILEHEKLFAKHGVSTVHLYPYVNKGRAEILNRFSLWGVLIEGEFTGYYTTRQVKALLIDLENQQKKIQTVYLHHLRGANLQCLKQILDSTDAPVYLLLHDYMTVCPTGGLVKNGECYCGPEAPRASKCEGCRGFHSEMLTRAGEISAFLKEEDRITYLAPSAAAGEVWLQAFPQYRDRLKVMYHQEWDQLYTENLFLLPEGAPLKIAFVGYQRELKGWPQWSKAAETAHKAGRNIEFYQFGRTRDSFPYIKEVSVDFKKNLEAMTEALRQYGIHCAVLWSMWPETYSYTYYEAFAANTFIITNTLSGNICAQVKKNQNGYIATEQEDLTDIFLNEENLRNMVNAYRITGKGGPLHLRQNSHLLETLPSEEKTAALQKRPFLWERPWITFLNLLLTARTS